ncbi:ABC transporter substrate-binding protein [Mesorhizobium sp. DCY119]|uniref:ABC transporter substrate-binding protein n=1 Tax=Mesorhizobium sp. DCY119 TaxID=2108445 RepID=UPI000E71625E|nr:ABC transporter substrate-binding protein [Mesorhizobium sp. DCY119]RJG41132.1 ABC transporter substrate-binding protein [Mesorhizobium sp. DCY119]
MKISTIATFVAATMAMAPVAYGAELKVGLAASTTSMDPQFYVNGPNSAMARNIFDGLINQDDKQQVQPALAESWKVIDDTTWEFKLRPNVKFHDGSDFTADDVIASVKRVALASQNSPSSFEAYVKDIVDVTAVDPLTVRITTKAPTPLLPNNLSRIAVMPAELEKTPTQDLNSGKGVIGTGPFKFVSWAPDDHVTLERFDGYWGEKAAWDKITFRVFKNSSARVAAILSGDVDLIESIPTADTRNLEKSDKLSVISVPGNRIMYLHMDQGRDISPFAVGADGKNPLQKVEVRKAMSLAINREALVDRIMDGQGLPAGQLVPEGYFGHSPDLGVDPYDAPKAKQMLADAGYPDGFKLTFHATNDRYPNDSKIAQAIGQMFSRIGIKTEVATMPGSVYFTRASALEFSLIMGGAAVETGEASGVLGPLLETYGEKAGQGNRGRYSNPEFDKALIEARSTLDNDKREKLLQTAMDIAMKDDGVIPVFFLANTWATKKEFTYQGRSDGYTLPYYVKQAN